MKQEIMLCKILYEDDFVKVGSVGKYQGFTDKKLYNWVGFYIQPTCRSIRETRDRELDDKENQTCKLHLSSELWLPAWEDLSNFPTNPSEMILECAEMNSNHWKSGFKVTAS